MASIPFHYVDLRTFSYVTEDDSRVEKALRHLLPEETAIDRATSEGHHGDPILVLSARIENADDIRTVLERIEALPAGEREQLESELEERVDEDTSFYVTLDKQAAFDGRTRLGQGITLRGKVEAYPANRDRAIENVTETFAEVL